MGGGLALTVARGGCLVRRVLELFAASTSDQFHFLSAPGFALHPHQQPSEAAVDAVES